MDIEGVEKTSDSSEFTNDPFPEYDEQEERKSIAFEALFGGSDPSTETQPINTAAEKAPWEDEDEDGSQVAESDSVATTTASPPPTSGRSGAYHTASTTLNRTFPFPAGADPALNPTTLYQRVFGQPVSSLSSLASIISAPLPHAQHRDINHLPISSDDPDHPFYFNGSIEVGPGYTAVGLARTIPQLAAFALNLDWSYASIKDESHPLGWRIVGNFYDNPRIKRLESPLVERKERACIEFEKLKSEISEMLTMASPVTNHSGSQQEPRHLSKPTVLLPGDDVTINQSAAELGKLLGRSDEIFLKNEELVQLINSHKGLEFEIISPAMACSLFEEFAFLERLADKGEVPDIASESDARRILGCRKFRDKIKRIGLLSNCPVLVNHDNELVVITGYDRRSETLAFGQPPIDMSARDAVCLLTRAMADFWYPSAGDQSRAFASLITPGMVFGGLLKGRAPIDFGEADDSQAGKGYRQKMIAAIYNIKPEVITQEDGGIGTIRDLFSGAMRRGASMIIFDNLRGAFDSRFIESAATEDYVNLRSAYSKQIKADMRRTLIQMTSNKFESSVDLSNRASIVRIKKRPGWYRFHNFLPGVDQADDSTEFMEVLDHIRANQPLYLGAVFAIIREWWRLGKQEDRSVRHDFRDWAWKLGWIVKNIFGAAPLDEGHHEIQRRISNPAENWLRDVSVGLIRHGQAGKWLRSGDIAKFVVEHGIETKGIDSGADLHEDSDYRKASGAIGFRMKAVIGELESFVIDSYHIEKRTVIDANRREVKEYRFSSTDFSLSSGSALSNSMEKSPFPEVAQGLPKVCPRLNADSPRCPRFDEDLIHSADCKPEGDLRNTHDRAHAYENLQEPRAPRATSGNSAKTQIATSGNLGQPRESSKNTNTTSHIANKPTPNAPQYGGSV